MAESGLLAFSSTIKLDWPRQARENCPALRGCRALVVEWAAERQPGGGRPERCAAHAAIRTDRCLPGSEKLEWSKQCSRFPRVGVIQIQNEDLSGVALYNQRPRSAAPTEPSEVMR